ncbi:hypothetical protein BVC80_9097g120 [Macleaya cordata]|uniref:Uncharacterized protein n=1 Tax=Macleaya cordata TaxID=56857 RepID=A0A200QF83_MACCD|nr:hypothetical protein BVC80_9097g120 [Macleaya cordata]
MSSRRSRSSRQQSGVSRITDDQINDLVIKLQQLLPELRHRTSDKLQKSYRKPATTLGAYTEKSTISASV